MSSTIALAAGLALSIEPQGDDRTFTEHVAPFIERHCVECHGAIEPEAELSFAALLAEVQGPAQVATWRRMREELRAARMPPKKRARPPGDEQALVLGWIDAFVAANAPPIDPGRVTLRRLNAREYHNSVRDLVGVDFDAQAYFPTDDVGHGFDNIGDVLSMPDVLFEKYAAAAEQIAARAIAVIDPAHPPERRLADEQLEGSEEIKFTRGAWALYRSGDVHGEIDVPHAGEYLLRVSASAQQAGPDPARMELRLGRKKVALVDVLAPRDAPEIYEQRVSLESGRARIAAAFVNDFYEPDNPDPSRRDRNLYVEWIALAGPIGALVPTEFQARFLDSSKTTGELVRELASRAWRRPATQGEVERLLALSPADATREESLRTALEALLVSPHFLFLVETDTLDAVEGSVRDLDAWELAARLSYFLWSSLPDHELAALCAADRLRDEAVLEDQVRRMLRDPRASALTQGFAAQWLQLGSLDRAAPDPQRFADFDPELRAAMRAETEMLFESVLREDRPVAELLDPDFTFVNERLAKHYGLHGVAGPALRRVRLDEAARETRGGVLAQASVLTVTSNPTRTSPVKRGKWILDNLLGTPPPPPTPGTDSLDESPEAARAASVRERLAQHRADPKCAVCHDRMDPLGLALEHFDPIGRWRDADNGFAIDASGELDGEHFDGVGDLKRRLAREPAFVRALSKKLATYALGRGLRAEDEPAIDALLLSVGREPTLADLILGVVRMDAFRRRVVARQ